MGKPLTADQAAKISVRSRSVEGRVKKIEKLVKKIAKQGGTAAEFEDHGMDRAHLEVLEQRGFKIGAGTGTKLRIYWND